MTPEELQEATDYAWRALGRSPMRRAMLGRERCDAIVRVSADHLADVAGELAACGDDAQAQAEAIHRLERRVRLRYSENCGFAFMTLVVVWAISAIVQALVIRWLNQQGKPS